MFRTRLTQALLDRAEAVLAGATPMGRIGQPAELAPIVLFLASKGATDIQGRWLRLMGAEWRSRSVLTDI
jgi:gluconate 5-dehydrogenase